MKILVTGGAGFIGSHIAQRCAAEGHEVTVLDNMRTGNRTNLQGVECDIVEGSVEDWATVRALAEDTELIYHLAALVSVPESMENPESAERINVLGTVNVLEAARATGARVVLSSTSAVYGDTGRERHSEEHLPEPASPYAISKLAAEHYCHMYRIQYGVPSAIFRYFNVYGPRQDPASPYAAAIAIFSRQARKGRPITIFGTGAQTRDFVYVDDVVEANRLAVQAPPGVYNVGTGERITITRVAETIREAAESRSPIRYEDKRPGDVMHSCSDPSRLRSLGWEPQVTLLEGLRRTLAWEAAQTAGATPLPPPAG